MEKTLKIYREQRSYIVETISPLHQGYKKFDNMKELLNYLDACDGQLDQYKLEVSDELKDTVINHLNNIH